MCPNTLKFYLQVIITNILPVIRKIYFSYILDKSWRPKDFVFANCLLKHTIISQ